MTTPHAQRGAFVLSVDLPPVRAVGATSGLADLLKVLTGVGIAATWYSSDPANSPDVERILAAMPAQEIGLSGESTWAHAGIGRTQFLRELSRRLAAAEAAGYSIGTLAMSEHAAVDHLDLAAKHDIDSVRTFPSAVPASLMTRSLTRLWGQEKTPLAKPRVGRFGLWHMPVSLRLPSRERFAISSTRLALRGLQQARDTGYFHLLIDLAGAGDATTSLVKSVERVLLAARHDAAHVAVLSVRQMHHRLTQRRVMPAQSILRRRAA